MVLKEHVRGKCQSGGWWREKALQLLENSSLYHMVVAAVGGNLARRLTESSPASIKSMTDGGVDLHYTGNSNGTDRLLPMWNGHRVLLLTFDTANLLPPDSDGLFSLLLCIAAEVDAGLKTAAAVVTSD